VAFLVAGFAFAAFVFLCSTAAASRLTGALLGFTTGPPVLAK